MKTKAVIYIVLAGILWGTSGIFVHFLAPYGFSSFQMASIRGTVSATCMSLYVLLKDKSIFKVSLRNLLLYAASGAAMYLTGSTYYTSIQTSSVSTAVILMYTAPVFVMIYSVIFFKEKLNFLKTLSVLGMLIGCALVSGIVGGIVLNLKGILFGLAAGLSYTAYNIITKIQMRKKCNPLAATLYCFIFMAIISMFVTPPSTTLNIAAANPAAIPFMIGVGIFTSVFPYFLYTLSLKILPVGTASALGIVEPMAATVFSVAFLGEVLGIYPAAGIVLILASVVILSLNKE